MHGPSTRGYVLGRESGGSRQRWSREEKKKEEGYQEELYLPGQQWKYWDPGSLSTNPVSNLCPLPLPNTPTLLIVFVYFPSSGQTLHEGRAFLYLFVVRKSNRNCPTNILIINEFHTIATLLHGSICHVQHLAVSGHV